LENQKKYYYRHRSGILEQKREYRRKNFRYMESLRLQQKYGITLDQKDEMMKAQNGLCYICKTPFDTTNHRRANTPIVDHDHKTGAVRKILCNRCNRAIGLFHDNSVILYSAANYIESFI
jgi:5-methylcytosine-specific restriction endonuclease McrA